MDDQDFDVLPAVQFKDDILSALRANQIIICIGETGSGKTTQIPQFIVDNEGFLANGKMVAITQPRRVAAVTVAARVADERDTEIGNEVGYSVRFDDNTSSSTRIKYMTDGVLVRECLHDSKLSKYQVVMLDEAHERSINTDILFGLLKSACTLRPDLKVIITSATLDFDRFSAYFNNCPVITIPGRTWDVDIYQSKTKQVMTVSGPSNCSYVEAAVDVVIKVHRKEEVGHILVFLTGQDEIEKACSLIRSRVQSECSDQDTQLVVLPLYAALPPEAQRRVFRKLDSDILLDQERLEQLRRESDGIGNGNNSSGGHGKNIIGATDGVNREEDGTVGVGTNRASVDHRKAPRIRKCVVATNIAETSITVPHVRYVVDAGYVKQKTYDPERRMETLIVVPISQVAAQQRAGRAGRTGPGQCYRLYSSECFSNMMPETIPEILRTNLANTILYLKVIGIHDVLGFDFIEPPSSSQIAEALVQLHLLGALDDSGSVTPRGRLMSQFPLEPSISRMLVAAAEESLDCLEEVVAIASMLSSENVWVTRIPGDRERGHARGNAMEIAHAAFHHPFGDHLTYLNIFQAFEEVARDDDNDEREKGRGGAGERGERGSQGGRRQREWCERYFLRHRSMRTALKIRDQLMGDCAKAGLVARGGASGSGGGGGRDQKRYDDRRGGGGVREDRGKQRAAGNLESRICKAVASGLFMNAARRCSHESIFRSLPLKLPTLSMDAAAVGASAEPAVSIFHMHQSSSLTQAGGSSVAAGSAGGRPPEYVVYQELVFASRVYMRHILGCDAEVLREYRTQWAAVHPLALCGRDPPTRPSTRLAPLGGVTGTAAAGAATGAGVGAGAASALGLVGVVGGYDGSKKRAREGGSDSVDSGAGAAGGDKVVDAVQSAKERFLARKSKK